MDKLQFEFPSKNLPRCRGIVEPLLLSFCPFFSQNLGMGRRSRCNNKGILFRDIKCSLHTRIDFPSFPCPFWFLNIESPHNSRDIDKEGLFSNVETFGQTRSLNASTWTPSPSCTISPMIPLLRIRSVQRLKGRFRSPRRADVSSWIIPPWIGESLVVKLQGPLVSDDLSTLWYEHALVPKAQSASTNPEGFTNRL
jgi:hypothetical protein